MTTTRAQQIAKEVKAARRERGLTQEQLAEVSGVHAQTVGNLERAKGETKAENLAAIGKVLDIDLGTTAVAARATVDLIRRMLLSRLSELDDVEQLRLAAEALQFVATWQQNGNGNGGHAD